MAEASTWTNSLQVTWPLGGDSSDHLVRFWLWIYWDGYQSSWAITQGTSQCLWLSVQSQDCPYACGPACMYLIIIACHLMWNPSHISTNYLAQVYPLLWLHPLWYQACKSAYGCLRGQILCTHYRFWTHKSTLAQLPSVTYPLHQIYNIHQHNLLLFCQWASRHQAVPSWWPWIVGLCSNLFSTGIITLAGPWSEVIKGGVCADYEEESCNNQRIVCQSSVGLHCFLALCTEPCLWCDSRL